MKNFLESVKRNMIFSAIFQIVAGALLIIYADSLLDIVCRLIGAACLVYGGWHLFLYIRKKNAQSPDSVELAQGIIGIAAGIFVLVAVKLVINILLILLGVLIIFESVMKFQDAFDLKKLGHQSWIFLLIVAVAMLVMGVLIVLKPQSLLSGIFTFAGIVMVVNACVDLFDIFVVSHQIKKAMK